MKSMLTEIIDAVNNQETAFAKACQVLSAGEVVGFPTETVYGIGADMNNLQAIKKIFEAKNRQENNPLAAHISDLSQVVALCDPIPDSFYVLAEKFLPGPLSIIMKKKKSVSELITGGHETLSIRFPSNRTALGLIASFGRPIAATSGNLSGMPSPVSAAHVLNDMYGRIPLIIDGGPSELGLDSTVISLATGGGPSILRHGAVTKESIEQALNIKIADEKPLFNKVTGFGLPVEILQPGQAVPGPETEYQGKKILLLVPVNSRIDTRRLEVKTITANNFYQVIRQADNQRFGKIFILLDESVESDQALKSLINSICIRK